MDNSSSIWRWSLIAPLVLAGLSLIGGGNTTYRQNRDHSVQNDLPRDRPV